MNEPRNINTILDDYIFTLAKVDKYHPGYARRLHKLMDEVLDHLPVRRLRKAKEGEQ